MHLLKIKEESEVFNTNHSVDTVEKTIREEIDATFTSKQFNFSGEYQGSMSYVLKDQFSFMVLKPSFGPLVFLEVHLKKSTQFEEEISSLKVKKRLGKTFYFHFWFPLFLAFMVFLLISYLYTVNSLAFSFEILFFIGIPILWGLIIYVVAYFKLESQVSRFERLLKSNNISFLEKK
ncbi:exosortase/archaeosortase family protein [Dokdonia pacifica]|uniref:exosortase/archaeosortase family protein n=1 Tax=Dokdonia pacifica TaxID=1627892 RepID=UPI001178913C|nr:exosortase/archaeosortase family protein [Dokdonia pacifica]